MREVVINRFRKLHRQLGLFLALFLCLLSATGIALNHTESLNLDQRYVPGWIAALYYSDQEVLGYRHRDALLYSFGGSLYANQTELVRCSTLIDRDEMGDQVLILCEDELILFTQDLELIERLDRSSGFPSGVQAVEVVDQNQLLVKVEGTWLSFDLFGLALAPIQGVVIMGLEHPPSESVPSEYLYAEAISWQQFVLDVHSGAVVGLKGKLFVDLIGIFVILMAISGVLMWRNPRKI